MVYVQTSDVDALPAPFSLAQQWVRVSKHYWLKHNIAGLKYEIG
jgi:hypothetical protein